MQGGAMTYRRGVRMGWMGWMGEMGRRCKAVAMGETKEPAGPVDESWMGGSWM